MSLANLEGSDQTFSGVAGRHADVDHTDIRYPRIYRLDQARCVLRLRHDIESSFAKDACQALTDQHGVIGKYHPHGSSATTRVPPPGGLTTASAPSRAATRSLNPGSPLPLPGSAPPQPSSSTLTTRRPAETWAHTVADCASACLPIFARDSATTK